MMEIAQYHAARVRERSRTERFRRKTLVAKVAIAVRLFLAPLDGSFELLGCRHPSNSGYTAVLNNETDGAFGELR